MSCCSSEILKRSTPTGKRIELDGLALGYGVCCLVNTGITQIHHVTNDYLYAIHLHLAYSIIFELNYFATEYGIALSEQDSRTAIIWMIAQVAQLIIMHCGSYEDELCSNSIYYLKTERTTADTKE
ncbi:hypothetical protein ACJX0J_011334 [Zea mays]